LDREGVMNIAQVLLATGIFIGIFLGVVIAAMLILWPYQTDDDDRRRQ
jgi:tetrahydromethanopterin S-methyltransferase subunit B